MTHIDDSLARGMAHAFLGHVAESDRICEERKERYYGRGRLPRSDNLKGYRKAVEHMRAWTPERYRICEWTAQQGKKAVWCGARLTRSDRVVPEGLAVELNEVTASGSAQTWTLGVTVSFHALQRVIQRSGQIKPPFAPGKLDPLYAEFNSLPVWAIPALYAAKRLDREDRARSSMLIPAEHGAWLCTDAGRNGLVVKTYLGEGADMWSEAQRALGQLRGFHERDLAPFHAAVFYPEWGWSIDEDVVKELHRVWHEWEWLNREREDRPGRDDRAWAEHRLQRGGTSGSVMPPVFCLPQGVTGDTTCQ